MWIILSLIGAYLLGSIPFSLIIGKRVKGIDLREHGSGNLGSTNVYRILGPGWGGLCLFLDIAKGALAVILVTVVVAAYPEGQDLPLHLNKNIYRIIAAVLGILGHSFSPFASFKGGKGIATTFGAFLVLQPYGILIAFGAFLSVFFATRIVSLGSLSAAAIFPWATVFFEVRSPKPFSLTLIIFSFALSGIIIWRHRANIKRLREGTEQPINRPKDDLEEAKAAADLTIREIAGDDPEQQ